MVMCVYIMKGPSHLVTFNQHGCLYPYAWIFFFHESI